MIGNGPCGPCAPNANPFGGPASGLWPSGGGLGPDSFVPGPVGAVGTPEPEPVGPPAVILGPAAFFKILTQAGITNIPTSSIIGNMGVSPITDVAITGFALTLDGSGEFSTSAQVNGRIYAANYAPPTPAMLTAAIAAMQAAYTDAAGRPADFTNVGAGLIGGMNLTPGVYKWTSGVTIASDLTFTGGPNDTWILQIDGTLDVAAGVNIILAGGAQKQNIVWQVAGAITIMPGALFQGTILAQTSIAVQTGASVLGKLYSQTAVTLDNNFVNG
jgi:ice-binding like protein